MRGKLFMNRRTFLTAASATAAASAAPRARAASPAADEGGVRFLERLDRAQALEERIRRIQDYVHTRHYDDKGILYSHTRFDQERAWREDDFKDSSGPNGLRPHEWMNYENSPMCAGIFLAGQCYRYLATKDPQALEYAAKAFRSIDTVFRLSEAAGDRTGPLMQRAGIIDPTDRAEVRRGWISKPYGQMMTLQSSTEQNFGPVWGLFLYRSIAPAATRERVDSIIVAVADYWRESRYTISFFGENWELEKSSPRAQRHMPVWAMINRVAFEVSGERRFRKEFERIDALFGAMPTAMQTNFGLGRYKYISTEDRTFHDKEVVLADLLMDLEPANRDRYLRAMTRWWQFGQIGMRDDLFAYYFIELDATNGQWKPLPKTLKPRPLWTDPWMFQNGTFPVAWGEAAARLALSSPIVARRSQELEQPARKLAQRIFAALDKSHLRYMIDPHDALEPEISYMANVLSGDALTYYPTGYWYGRLHGLWS